MAEVVYSHPDRTAKDVARDLERLLAGVGDSAPACEMVMSVTDYQLLRGVAGQPGVNLPQDFPGITKALKMNVRLPPGYNGPPRITKVLGKDSFDAHAAKARRDDLIKKRDWLENDARLRQGINGRPLL